MLAISANALAQEITTYTVKGVSFDMVSVEEGTFLMGSNNDTKNEQPVHLATVSSFKIGRYEVTQALWQAVMGNNPSEFKGANNPVNKVKWGDVHAFIGKLNELTGQNFRLPSEAEWEFAARGGNWGQVYQYSGSDNIDEVAWYKGNSGSKIHEVGLKKPNELGIYDMTGNVEEWCMDIGATYPIKHIKDYVYTHDGYAKGYITRGGDAGSDKIASRVFRRYNTNPENYRNALGLRLAQ